MGEVKRQQGAHCRRRCGYSDSDLRYVCYALCVHLRLGCPDRRAFVVERRLNKRLFSPICLPHLPNHPTLKFSILILLTASSAHTPHDTRRDSDGIWLTLSRRCSAQNSTWSLLQTRGKMSTNRCLPPPVEVWSGPVIRSSI